MDKGEALATAARLVLVIEQARTVFRDDDKANAFFDTPHPLLAGKTPFAVAQEGEQGAVLIMNLIGRIDLTMPPFTKGDDGHA